jgi:WS/DGAT/MGAT family acyltransferase
MTDEPRPAPPGPDLSDADSIMWRIAADPVLRTPIVVVGLLDRAPDTAALAATFGRAGDVLPGLRSRIAAPTGGIGRPRWVPDPAFAPEHHIRRVGATSGDVRCVLDLAEPDATAPFDPERPPWSLTVVEGLAADRAAFVLRFHHAITDGMGGLQAAAQIFDRRRHPPGPVPAATPPVGDTAGGNGQAHRPAAFPLPGRLLPTARSLASAGRSAALDPLGTVSGSLRLARSLGRLIAGAPSGSPLLAGRGLHRHLHVVDFALADLRAAADAAGGTVNDLLLAAVAGAFRQYHERHGEPVSTMAVMMPIDRRRPGDGVTGNRFAPARFSLPVDEPDLVTRTRVAAAISRSWQTEPALSMTDRVAGALNRLPGPVVVRVFGNMLRTMDADVVDLAGLVEPAYVGGARIERMWAFAPPTGAAFSVTLLSHVDRACVAVACDRAAVPRPEVLADLVESALDEALALAGQGAAGHEQEVAP